jgi:hypothetical protein
MSGSCWQRLTRRRRCSSRRLLCGTPGSSRAERRSSWLGTAVELLRARVRFRSGGPAGWGDSTPAPTAMGRRRSTWRSSGIGNASERSRTGGNAHLMERRTSALGPADGRPPAQAGALDGQPQAGAMALAGGSAAVHSQGAQWGPVSAQLGEASTSQRSPQVWPSDFQFVPPLTAAGSSSWT